ncbi:MAG: EpsG family protein [Bacteroidales bacterium]|nr:EpsG family protein [Bacteroidales bacterium]
MITILIVSFVAMILTFLDSRKILDGGMIWGFVLLTIVAAIHYNVGNDYMDYLHLYEAHTSYGVNLKLVLSGDVYKDVGWALLELIFRNIGGFFSMVAFLSVFQSIVYYRFIKDFMDRPWWPLSMFIYLFVINHYLVSMSALRQGFAMSLAILAFMLSVKGQESYKFKRFALIVLSLLVAWFATGVHKTAPVIFLIILLTFIPFRRGLIFMLWVTVFFGVMMFNKNFMESLFSMLTLVEDIDDFAKTYEAEESAGSIGLGFVLNLVPSAVCILYMLFCPVREYVMRRKQVIAIFSLYLLILPMAFLNHLAGRVGWYFTVFSMLALPYAYSWIKNDYIRAGLISLYVTMTAFDYYTFFTNSIYADYYRDFHTIFEVIF